MSILSSAKAVLEADATLLALATGGIWDADEAGAAGINRTSTPGAFSNRGTVKPCVLLKVRGRTPDGIVDDGRTISARQVLECWCYQERGTATIESIQDRIYVLLQAVSLTGTFPLAWSGDTPLGLRDEELDAYVGRSDYAVNYVRT